MVLDLAAACGNVDVHPGFLADAMSTLHRASEKTVRCSFAAPASRSSCMLYLVGGRRYVVVV